MVKALEPKDGFYEYDIIDEDEVTRLTLRLPVFPDNCGWFKVKYPDGRGYTLYGLDTTIEEYINDHPNDDEVEADEDNELIELRNDLLKTLTSKTDKATAKALFDELWGNYKIDRY